MGSRSEQKRLHEEKFFKELPSIQVCYTNHRGETRIRTIIPVRFAYKKSYFHEGQSEQWIVECYDTEKRAMRDYALKDCNFALSNHPSVVENIRSERVV